MIHHPDAVARMAMLTKELRAAKKSADVATRASNGRPAMNSGMASRETDDAGSETVGLPGSIGVRLSSG